MTLKFFRNVLNSSLLTLTLAASAAATQYKVIYTFQNLSDAYQPQTQMIADGAGNLYGVTQFGGAHGLGTVFELSPGSNGTWTEKILYSFAEGTDGGQPWAGVVMDKNGNLYGTTSAGGDASCTPIHGYCGVAYELSPNSNGTWTETVLVDFTGDNGLTPYGNLILDGAGNLYGTTQGGGPNGWGIVFELSPNGDGTWSENILHGFGKDGNGAKPYSNLVFDAQGNLWGTTTDGGLLADCLYQYGCGTVFEMTPQAGGGWSEKAVLAFDGGNGATPAGLIFDASGDVFGTTYYGGPGSCSGLVVGGCGEIFELVAGNGSYKPRIIQQFQKEPVAQPQGIIFDSQGNMYGTSFYGGVNTCAGANQPCGTIYKGAPNGRGGFTFSVLYDFPGESTNGFWPYAPLTIDGAGNIYGSTGNGGNLSCGISGGCGVVYQIIP
ncbi:MAG TPA: choice-of-anchor tandem repeat GloVer-containing protein [Candidatus Binatia bacterium]|nr:choice-of-anchor tandem repeat GloVer-containing protein [Candidatus Binatia bacterium]